MLDALLLKLTGPVLDAVARRLALNALGLAVLGFAIGLAALPVIVMKMYLPGLALFALSRPVSALAAASARQSGQDEIVVTAFDAICFAGVPFAFALADPSRALAAVFLMFGLAARLASALLSTRSLIGNTEILIAVAIACAFPDRFGIVAYVLGVLFFVAAGGRIAARIAQRRTP